MKNLSQTKTVFENLKSTKYINMVKDYTKLFLNCQCMSHILWLVSNGHFNYLPEELIYQIHPSTKHAKYQWLMICMTVPCWSISLLTHIVNFLVGFPIDYEWLQVLLLIATNLWLITMFDNIDDITPASMCCHEEHVLYYTRSLWLSLN
jgi:uncharacterized membrane protein